MAKDASKTKKAKARDKTAIELNDGEVAAPAWGQISRPAGEDPGVPESDDGP